MVCSFLTFSLDLNRSTRELVGEIIREPLGSCGRETQEKLGQVDENHERDGNAMKAMAFSDC